MGVQLRPQVKLRLDRKEWYDIIVAIRLSDCTASKTARLVLPGKAGGRPEVLIFTQDANYSKKHILFLIPLPSTPYIPSPPLMNVIT